MSFQSELELNFDKNTLYSQLKSNLIKDIELKEHISSINIDSKFIYDVILQMMLIQKCHIKTLCGILYNNSNSSIQKIANDILTLIELDILDANENGYLYSNYEPDESEKKLIQQMQYPLPMVTEPKKLNYNYDSPYETYNKHVVMGDSINKHNDDVNLDHLNKLNKISLCINQKIFHHVTNTWKKNSNKQRKALDFFTQKENDVVSAIFIAGNKFYFSHGYDKRGRTYARGYHINYMGNQYQKSLIEFSIKEFIND